MSLKKIVLTALVLLAVLGLAGFVYQTVARHRDEANYPAPGQLIDVGGYKMHISDMGLGMPSVVMDAGTGSFSLMWQTVPAHVAQFTHVYTFDRAGLGWSEESPLPRTAANMVKELHVLLEKAGVPKPYIMVGHSLGGGTVQMYADLYPDEVFGLVLVDAGHEDIIKKMLEHYLVFERTMTGFTAVDAHAAQRSKQSAAPSVVQKAFLWLASHHYGEKFLELAGIKRLYLEQYYNNPNATQYPMTPAIHARLLAPTTFHTCSEEITHYPESAQQLAPLENKFSNKPLIVIANGKGFFYNPLNHTQMTPSEIIFNTKVWDPIQKELAEKSSKGKLIIATQSGHRIQDTEPELIVNAIKEIVDEYRAQNS